MKETKCQLQFQLEGNNYLLVCSKSLLESLKCFITEARLDFCNEASNTGHLSCLTLFLQARDNAAFRIFQCNGLCLRWHIPLLH